MTKAEEYPVSKFLVKMLLDAADYALQLETQVNVITATATAPVLSISSFLSSPFPSTLTLSPNVLLHPSMTPSPNFFSASYPAASLQSSSFLPPSNPVSESSPLNSTSQSYNPVTPSSYRPSPNSERQRSHTIAGYPATEDDINNTSVQNSLIQKWDKVLTWAAPYPQDVLTFLQLFRELDFKHEKPTKVQSPSAASRRFSPEKVFGGNKHSSQSPQVSESKVHSIKSSRFRDVSPKSFPSGANKVVSPRHHPSSRADVVSPLRLAGLYRRIWPKQNKTPSIELNRTASIELMQKFLRGGDRIDLLDPGSSLDLPLVASGGSFMSELKGPQLTEGDECGLDSGRVWCRSSSTYPMKADLTRSGDPICDYYCVRVCDERVFVALADGCNWGRRPKEAAQRAGAGFLEYVTSKNAGLANCKNVNDILLSAFATAHQAIIHDKEDVYDAGTCTLLGGMLLRLQSGEWMFCCAGVGDCKAYLYSPKNNKVTDIMAFARQNSSACDPGGRIGPTLGEYGHPDLRNLQLRSIICEDGDIVFLVSDGIHDNLDPQLLGLRPSELGHLLTNDHKLVSADRIFAFSKSNPSLGHLPSSPLSGGSTSASALVTCPPTSSPTNSQSNQSSNLPVVSSLSLSPGPRLPPFIHTKASTSPSPLSPRRLSNKKSSSIPVSLSPPSSSPPSSSGHSTVISMTPSLSQSPHSSSIHYGHSTSLSSTIVFSPPASPPMSPPMSPPSSPPSGSPPMSPGSQSPPASNSPPHSRKPVTVLPELSSSLAETNLMSSLGSITEWSQLNERESLLLRTEFATETLTQLFSHASHSFNQTSPTSSPLSSSGPSPISTSSHTSPSVSFESSGTQITGTNSSNPHHNHQRQHRRAALSGSPTQTSKSSPRKEFAHSPSPPHIEIDEKLTKKDPVHPEELEVEDQKEREKSRRQERDRSREVGELEKEEKEKEKEKDEREERCRRPEEVVKILFDYVFAVTASSRQFLEQNPSTKLPNDFTRFPGKLDHVTCIAFTVGRNPTITASQNNNIPNPNPHSSSNFQNTIVTNSLDGTVSSSSHVSPGTRAGSAGSLLPKSSPMKLSGSSFTNK